MFTAAFVGTRTERCSDCRVNAVQVVGLHYAVENLAARLPDQTGVVFHFDANVGRVAAEIEFLPESGGFGFFFPHLIRIAGFVPTDVEMRDIRAAVNDFNPEIVQILTFGRRVFGRLSKI